MLQFQDPSDLLAYLRGTESSSVRFNKVRIRKNDGFISISTDSEELCLSMELNRCQDQLFTAEDIVSLIVSLPN